jgi:hypothetical protein
MKRILHLSGSLACVLVVFQIASAQTGAPNVYRNQFFDLRARVQSLVKRTEPQSRATWTNKTRMDLREEILALTKLIHRLEEESLASNLDNARSDKTILLVSTGCKAMDFVLEALDSYIDTDDRSFLGLARDGDVLIKSVERLL